MPPSEVKSFWYSISTTAVVAGSIAMLASSSGAGHFVLLGKLNAPVPAG
jgi:hypothetical protein